MQQMPAVSSLPETACLIGCMARCGPHLVDLDKPPALASIDNDWPNLFFSTSREPMEWPAQHSRQPGVK